MRARALRVAGIAIILLGVGAALLPAGKTISSDMIGGLLIAAGLIETVAGSLRRESRAFAMAAGVVTALAGLLFIVNPETHFFPTVWPIIGWLLIRSLILAGSLTEIDGSVRRWTAISAGLDYPGIGPDLPPSGPVPGSPSPEQTPPAAGLCHGARSRSDPP